MKLNYGGSWQKVGSLKEASESFRTYIEGNGFGGSDLRRTDGALQLDDGRLMHVSFNGRIWDGSSQDWTNATTCRFNPAAGTFRSQ